MHRLAKPGGLGIFSCATVDRSEHGSKRSDRGFSAPFVAAGGAECYRSESEMRAVFSALRPAFSSLVRSVEPVHCDLFFVGIITSEL